MEKELTTTASKPHLLGLLSWYWGLGGIAALLVVSVVRLATISIDSLSVEWSLWHWVVLVVHTAFMAYAEGYRGFQRSFAPRVVARAWHLREHPTVLNAVAAPLFCMGYFGTTKRRLIGAYMLTIAIVILIILFQSLSQPLRGILDVGVVVGLGWGTASMMAFAVSALRTGSAAVSPELS